jgi:hypothetical protein
MQSKAKNFDFNAFISGTAGLNFTLAVGIFWLVSTYAYIIYFITDKTETLWFDVTLSVLKSLFFGFTTIIVIRQAQTHWVKVLFASFEGVGIFLYYSRDYLGVWAKMSIVGYVSVFSAFSLFCLGFISLRRYIEEKEKDALKIHKNGKFEPILNGVGE